MRHLTIIAAVLILMLVLFLVACQQSTIIATLENVVSAAEIAIPVIGAATGLNPATTTAIVSYLQQVNIATAEAATILAGAGTNAQKTALIIQAFAKLVAGCNCVPPGTPQEVVAVVNAVTQAVLQFLTNFPATPTPAPVIKVSSGDRTKLTSIKTRAEANMAKLKGVKK
jgi:hypothetical protein